MSGKPVAIDVPPYGEHVEEYYRIVEYRRIVATALDLAERLGVPPEPDVEAPAVPGDDETAFLQAMMALAGDRKDIEPLTAFLLAGRSLTRADKGTLAVLLSRWHARLYPNPKGGRPRYVHERWEKPHYIAAKIARGWLEAWRVEHGKKQIPKKISDKIVGDVCREIERWAFIRGKPRLKRERVHQLLRKPRTRGL
jgi:hypothetical protein